jgi:hypothetical protein
MYQDDNNKINPVVDEPTASQASTMQPVSPPPVESTLPPMTPPSRSSTSRRKTLLIVACAIILIGLIGGLAYMFMQDKPTDNNSTTSTETTQDQNEADSKTMSAAEQLVSELMTKMSGESQPVEKTSEYGGFAADDRTVYSTASYQSGDQKFAVYPANTYGFGRTSTAEIAENNMTAITSYLTTHNFSEVGAATSDSVHIYASKDAVCAVQLYTSATDGRDSVGVGCGNMSDYDKNYQTLLPFYTAYVESKPEFAESLALSSLTINEGVSGYKNAHVAINSSLPDAVGGFAGIFYLTPASDKWTYLIGTQSNLPCETFPTTELKKAFTGQECYETGTDKSVTIGAND